VNRKIDITPGFDFGFTVVSKEETGNGDKAQKIYDLILPLLANLKSNPEKDYIHWPNRTEKIEEFQQKLLDVLREN
jgi:hypothetical protein